jgi:hypothetical protein
MINKYMLIDIMKMTDNADTPTYVRGKHTLDRIFATRGVITPKMEIRINEK